MDVSGGKVALEFVDQCRPDKVLDLLMDEVERLQAENAALLGQLVTFLQPPSGLNGTIVGAGDGVRLLGVRGRVVRLVAPLDVRGAEHGNT